MPRRLKSSLEEVPLDGAVANDADCIPSIAGPNVSVFAEKETDPALATSFANLWHVVRLAWDFNARTTSLPRIRVAAACIILIGSKRSRRCDNAVEGRPDSGQTSK
mmetsp:Transcript_42665/g.129593  ORF Transcript_42665/g.129593 Transcript_42665/m.129593 type:complete len:106 (+) Transcript_42665:4245-4562(+)